MSGAGERRSRPRKGDEAEQGHPPAADAIGGEAADAATQRTDEAGTSSRAVPEPGSLAQEAALLAAAVREWLTTHNSPPGHAAAADAMAATGWDPFGPEGPLGPGPATNTPADIPDPSGWDDAESPTDWENLADGDTPPRSRAGPPWAVSPGSTLCTGCPLCRLLASLGGSHAEVVGHLLAAASSLAAAARAAWPPAGLTDDRPSAGPFADQREQAERASSARNTATPRARSPRDRVQRINVQ